MKRVAAIGLLFVASCSRGPAPEANKSATAPAPEVVDQDTPLNRRLLEIAGEYAQYGPVDLKFSWVQTLCRLQSVHARYSESDDASTHGNKLYLLYAKDWKAYVPGIAESQPVGQVIVKEAWEPLEVSKDQATGFHGEGIRNPIEAAVRDGKRFAPGRKHGLFIMLKEEQGWRYGTVTPDGKRVLQSGHIRSCYECHRTAKPDALFGLPGRPQDR